MNAKSELANSYLKSENQLSFNNNLIEPKINKSMHIQNLEKALSLNTLLKQVHNLIDDKSKDDTLDICFNRQQTKDVSSIYSFSKLDKNKKWLKNILIDNSDSDDSNEDLEKSVQELLKLRKYQMKITQKYYSLNFIDTPLNISSETLYPNCDNEYNDSFKNKIFTEDIKNEKIKCQNKKIINSKVSKKKIKLENNQKVKEAKLIELNSTLDQNNILKNENYLYSSIDNLTNKEMKPVNEKIENILSKKDLLPENNLSTINNLIDSNSLESKLMDDIKYDTTLPDEILQTETNMNTFVNSCLPILNDEIVYSNQLPDEIFETEEENSNGFQCQLQLLNSNFLPINNNNNNNTNTNNNNNVNSNNNIIVNNINTNNSNFVNINASNNIINNLTVSNSNIVNNNVNISINNSINNINNNESISINNENINIDNNKININNNQHQTHPCLQLHNNNTIINKNVNKTADVTIAIITNSLSNNFNIIKNSTDESKVNNNFINLNEQIIYKENNTIKENLNEDKNFTNNDKLIQKNKIKLIKKKDKIIKNVTEGDSEIIDSKRKRLWISIVKKDVPKAYKLRLANRKEVMSNCKKLANSCLKERKNVIGIPKLTKERSKKSNKEMATYWKPSKKPENYSELQIITLPKISEILNDNLDGQPCFTIT